MKSITSITAGALVLLSGNSMAQDTAEVRVEASRIISKTSDTWSAIGFPMKDLSLTYGISLADLDLSTKSGVAEAEKRVNAAAVKACKEIGNQYPDATPSEEECASHAARQAMQKVQQVAAAAHK